MKLTEKQKETLSDIRWQIEMLMDDIYPEGDFMIPIEEDVLEFIEGFQELYAGEFEDDDHDE